MIESHGSGTVSIKSSNDYLSVKDLVKVWISFNYKLNDPIIK